MRDVREWRPDDLRSTAWWPVRILSVSIALICFGLGLILGRLTAADPAVETAVGPASAAEAIDAALTEEAVVAGAVEVRAGPVSPAAVDDLVIVEIAVTRCGERAVGSGVLVADDTILTAAHVVGDAGLVRVRSDAQTLTAEVAGVFVDGRDLAVIELSAPLASPVIAGAGPALGEAVTIVGYPEGGPRTSVVGPSVEVPDLAARLLDGPLVAVDAATTSGMSGGPAVDADGSLVGVLVAAQPGTGTAIVSGIGDIESLLDLPLVDGSCPETA